MVHALLVVNPSMVQAVDTTTTDSSSKTPFLVQGTVILAPNTQEIVNRRSASVQAFESEPALYITCRPDRPDNVPAAILSGTRGKPPPVLAARFAKPSFPFSFSLTDDNLTAEGMAASSSSSSTKTFWWENDDLIVSARWDSDGAAATRSPEDLVGRGLLRRKIDDSVVVVQLEDRGAFGKFATKKS